MRKIRGYPLGTSLGPQYDHPLAKDFADGERDFLTAKQDFEPNMIQHGPFCKGDETRR